MSINFFKTKYSIFHSTFFCFWHIMIHKKKKKRFTLDGNPVCGMYADSNSLYSIKSLGFASWSVANSICGKLSSEITQIPQKEVLFWPTGALGAVVNYWFRYIR